MLQAVCVQVQCTHGSQRERWWWPGAPAAARAARGPWRRRARAARTRGRCAPPARCPSTPAT